MDIKTSTKGWDDKTKKDDIKQFQLILYKKYFAKQFGLEEDNIEIEFFIVKRKVWEDAPYPISRLQEFRPPSGKIKTNRATKTVEEFITKVFNHDGTHKTDNHSSNPSKWNCRYCPFGKDKNLCKDSILQGIYVYLYITNKIKAMTKKDMTLTSVKVQSELFDQFKINCVKYKFSLQKLTDRSIHL